MIFSWVLGDVCDGLMHGGCWAFGRLLRVAKVVQFVEAIIQIYLLSVPVAIVQIQSFQ